MIKPNPNSYFSRVIKKLDNYVELDEDETDRFDAKKYIERFYGEKYIKFQINPNMTYKVFIIDRKYYIKLEDTTIYGDVACYFLRIYFSKQIDRPYHRDIIKLISVQEIVCGDDMFNPEFKLIVYRWELVYRKNVVTKKNRELLTYQQRKHDSKNANLRIFSMYNIDDTKK